MVTILRNVYSGRWVHDVRCLSTDEKPIEGVNNGSTCLEMDTGKIYVFDKDNEIWYEF